MVNFDDFDMDGLVVSDQEAYRQREGFARVGVLDENKLASVGLELFRAAEGTHLIDFIPFIAGPNHPLVVSGRLQEGKKVHTIAVGLHRKVGPNNDDVICMSRTYNQPCGRCAVREKLEKDPNADEEIIKALQTSRYPLHIYLIWDRKNESKGLQVWAISGWFMEKHLQSRSAQPVITSESLGAIGTGKIVYAHPGAGPEGGRHVTFTVKGKGLTTEFLAHDFIIRKNPIPKQILEKAWSLPPLDTFLVIPDYEELKALSLVGIAEEDTSSHHEVELPVDVKPKPRQVQGQVQVKPKEPKCPYGANIGADYGQYEECFTCKEREVCESLAPKNEEELPWQEETKPETEQEFEPEPLTLKPSRPTPVSEKIQGKPASIPPRPTRPVRK